MNKEDILRKAQDEGKGKDYADLEAQRRGAYRAYFVGILLIILVGFVEGFVFKQSNYGGTMAIFAMGFTAFLTKYILLRKRHELFVMLMFGVSTLVWAALWILHLCGRIV